MIFFIILLSIFFQLSATVLALKLIGITRRMTAWLLLASAIALMTVRRVESLLTLIWGGAPAGTADAAFETIGLALSILMFAGVYQIRPLFSQIMNSREQLRSMNRRLKGLSEEQQLLA